jgi:hypothetical protein
MLESAKLSISQRSLSENYSVAFYGCTDTIILEANFCFRHGSSLPITNPIQVQHLRILEIPGRRKCSHAGKPLRGRHRLKSLVL